MQDFWSEILDFCVTTTNKVGKQLMLDFGKVQGLEKADGSLVTQADKWADQEITNAIMKAFPDHGILSEENNQVFPGTDWCWVIDPLDGTTNFTRGIPIWGVSLGLLYHGVPVFGYVFMPPLNQVFHGFWGGNSGLEMPTGAFLNHGLIETSKDPISGNHFLNLCSRSTAIIQAGFPCKLRMLGVASYNFLTVAMGAVLGGIEATPKVWDIAGAWVILKAAGGTWKSLQDDPFPLLSGVDYGSKSFPTIVLSYEDLITNFQQFLENLNL